MDSASADTKPQYQFKVSLVKPNPKARKNCPSCRGLGYYTALSVGEYDETTVTVTCACLTRGD